ncbi:MAG: hypothetical protein M1393_01435 [Candidatus Thermoplasmatota archaeon]|nr:hypothetical protein [Candidatus Thermoplasmatota archaeon]
MLFIELYIIASSYLKVSGNKVQLPLFPFGSGYTGFFISIWIAIALSMSLILLRLFYDRRKKYL